MPSELVMPMQDARHNGLLRALPPADLERIRPLFEPVRLVARVVMLPEGEEVAALLFPIEGTISMLTSLEDGTRIEVRLVGPEGVVGLPLVLGGDRSALEGLVQVDGLALRLSASGYRSALAACPALLGLLLRYVDTFHAQITQSAACNVRHDIEQRLARWVLMTQDRVGSDTFLMTQEFMSTMLGVGRPSVTLAIGALQRAGLVRHAQGRLQVMDRAGLEAVSCECYAVVARRFLWLTQPLEK